MAAVYIKTLGCKVNSFDSHALENQFQALGYKLINDAGTADVTIINTCSVTSNAEKEARYLARRWRRENPQGLLVMTGCYAQTDSARLAALPEVDFVVPNERKRDLAELVHSRLQNKGEHVEKLPAGSRAITENRQTHFKSSLTLFASPRSSQTRAFVKVQDGCNNFCSYCIIPYARGMSVSVPKSDVMREVYGLVAGGTKEIVLTGIHIGDYGHDRNDGIQLVTLLKELTKVAGLARIRISSLEPSELSEELLDFMASNADIFCDHFHLPLQSGHDRILRLMRRSYTADEYQQKLVLVKKYFPQSSCGADVMVGFPGETEEEFAASHAFIENVGLNYLHVFPYSRRPNTSALRLPGHLPSAIIRQRSSAMRDLSQKLMHSYAKQFIGTNANVLWESDRDESGRQIGHTKNFLPVASASGSANQAGTISSVKLKGFVENERLLALPMKGSF